MLKLMLDFLAPFQIEREKADLSVQVIQMSERLEEAEGGAEHQVSILAIFPSYIKSKCVILFPSLKPTASVTLSC